MHLPKFQRTVEGEQVLLRVSTRCLVCELPYVAILRGERRLVSRDAQGTPRGTRFFPQAVGLDDVRRAGLDCTGHELNSESQKESSDVWWA